jgi:carboxymethylenebutenolidase
MMALEIERAGRDLVHAVDVLRREPATDGAKIGCIGFCMGGELALHAACMCPEIGAVVDCYGVHPGVSLDLASCEARILGIFAEHDAFVSASDVQQLEEALSGAGIEATMRTFEGVQHAFLNEDRPDVFDAEASAAAWRDIETFFES